MLLRRAEPRERAFTRLLHRFTDMLRRPAHRVWITKSVGLQYRGKVVDLLVSILRSARVIKVDAAWRTQTGNLRAQTGTVGVT